MLPRMLLALTLLAVPALGLEPPPGATMDPVRPRQVWATLPEARRAASSSRHALVLLASEDGARYQAALAFFRSLEGVKARRNAEVWLPAPGNPEAARLLEDLGLHSLPALAALAPSGKKALRSRLGEDCVPLAQAFDQLLGEVPVPPALVQEWIGKDQALEPFLAFAAARKADLGSGAREPHRSWLMGLLQGRDERLQGWAATRFVEADAVARDKEPKAFPIFLEQVTTRFDREVRQGNPDRSRSRRGWPAGSPRPSFAGQVDPPMADLGDPGQLADLAPCWAGFRATLKRNANLKFTIPLYALLAPRLLEEDRAWVLAFLAKAGQEGLKLEARKAALYWIATDWLLVYGKPGDWDGFGAAMAPLGWSGDLARLAQVLKTLPIYWDSSPGLQSMFCEGATQESFWEQPDACLASWGVTREALVEFGLDQMKVKAMPTPPHYPLDAKVMGFSTTVRLRMLVGPDGLSKWVRPEPGYALAIFAPASMAYALAWRFEPARVAGVARPSQFMLTMPFALRK